MGVETSSGLRIAAPLRANPALIRAFRPAQPRAIPPVATRAGETEMSGNRFWQGCFAAMAVAGAAVLFMFR
jgi:hypothetical protein